MRLRVYLASFCLLGLGSGENDVLTNNVQASQGNSDAVFSENFNDLDTFLLAESDYSEEHVPIVRLASCENLTETEMAIILANYPNVRIRCELEKSILSPVVLSESETTPYGGPNMLHNEKFTFIERGAKLQLRQMQVRYPISPCVRPSSMGSGQIEVTITLNTLAKRMSEISGKIPILEMQAGKAFYITEGKEFVFSATCVYENEAVRAAVEVLTLITSFQTREWTITQNKQLKIEKSDWKTSRAAEISESSLVISCLSEKFVPNVCSWTESEALGEITKYFPADNDRL